MRMCVEATHLPPGLRPGPDGGFSLQQAAHTQEALEEAAQMMREAVEDLTATLNEAASAAGVVGGMVDSIRQAINQVSKETTARPPLGHWASSLGSPCARLPFGTRSLAKPAL